MLDDQPQMTDEEFREEYQRLERKIPETLADWMAITAHGWDPSQGPQPEVAKELVRRMEKVDRLARHPDFSLICQYMSLRGISDPSLCSVTEYYAYRDFADWGGEIL